MNRIWKFLTSLRLTVTLLALGIALIFIGTVAQADEGLYVAQERYFKHWFIFGISFFGHKIPMPFPGGYLIGTALLISLTSAFIHRFQWTTKKIGIHLTHVGIILLLTGQLVTDLLSRETQMRIREGQTRSYSESPMDFELAFEWEADTNSNEVVAIPQAMLTKGAELKHEKLPFTVRVKEFLPNSNPSFRAPAQQNAPPLTTNGIANSFDFAPSKVTYDMDSKNVPVALVELVSADGSLGDWVAAGWATDESMSESLWRWHQRRDGPQIGAAVKARLEQPQIINVKGKEITLAMRPVRAYKPYSFTLLKATHDVYQGTDTPKDFRSRIRIQNTERKEDRETEIYMNNPLRYSGLTFFQSGMIQRNLIDAGETPWTVFQVVRNPGWITPYAGCIIVAAGLLFQFMFHLVKFLRKRTA